MNKPTEVVSREEIEAALEEAKRGVPPGNGGVVATATDEPEDPPPGSLVAAILTGPAEEVAATLDHTKCWGDPSQAREWPIILTKEQLDSVVANWGQDRPLPIIHTFGPPGFGIDWGQEDPGGTLRQRLDRIGPVTSLVREDEPKPDVVVGGTDAPPEG